MSAKPDMSMNNRESEKTEELLVSLGERSYPIIIGTSLLSKSTLLEQAINGQQVMVVSNSTIAPLYMEQVLATLDALPNVEQIDQLVLPDGEQFKHLDTIKTIYDALMEKKHNRKTTLIALGGGVIGDMVGFAAATYQRGVNFVQLPTTLLAQVDSSVGGKTGVNHSKGKNMIGAFYQPKAVIIDLNTLVTLSGRDYRAGIAEIVKYGLIWDESFFCWLEENQGALLSAEAPLLRYAIKRACEIKAEVVRQDERESGIRAILNLGHTFGHAIETATHYQRYLHGEAVAIGMVMAVQFSEHLGWLASGWSDRVMSLLKSFQLPVKKPDDISAQQMIDLMGHDKKVLNKQLRLVLLKSCGQAEVTSDFSISQLEALL